MLSGTLWTKLICFTDENLKLTHRVNCPESFLKAQVLTKQYHSKWKFGFINMLPYLKSGSKLVFLTTGSFLEGKVYIYEIRTNGRIS